MKFAYLIEYVADMDRAVSFYRDQLGLTLRFQTPEWTEFDTGATTLALHIASGQHPAGTLEMGFNVPDIHQFYGEATAKGVEFVSPPAAEQFGTFARLKDSEGTIITVSRAGK